MTQADDIQACTTIPNPVDMVNCIRSTLGYAPVAPSGTGDGGGGGVACGTDQYNIPIIGCVQKNYVLVGGAAILALYFIKKK